MADVKGMTGIEAMKGITGMKNDVKTQKMQSNKFSFACHKDPM